MASGKSGGVGGLGASLSALDSPAALAKLGGAAGVAASLGSDLVRGLPSARVARNRADFGENQLPRKEPRGFLSHLIEALEDDTLRILIVSAAASMAFGLFLSPPESKRADIIQAVAILLAIVVVSGVNSFQNWSKDAEFASLAALREDRAVAVIRDGVESSLRIYDVVVGDLLKLASGDAIPCDGIAVSSFELTVNQSSMTGESDAVPKGSGDGEDAILMGSTLVNEGEGLMLATAVGRGSRIGQMVKLLETEPTEDTPLQERLDELAKQIGQVGTAAGVLTFLVLSTLWYFRVDPAKSTMDLIQYFIIGVAIVVVAVPEGLPLAVTISLAFSMRRMMKDNNLVRQLAACETMGSATVIASDKTGTLTQNRMEVVEAFAFGVHVQRMDTIPTLLDAPGALSRLAKAIAINSSADLRVGGDKRIEYLRSPTECALLLLGNQWLSAGGDYATLRAGAGAPLARRPFKKENKFMTTVARPESSKEGPIVYVSGAPEVVLEHVTKTHDVHGAEHDLSEERLSYLRESVSAMARKGLRTLALTYRRLPKGADKASAHDLLEYGETRGLTLLGLFGIHDPLREGVASAVKQCQRAGIRVMMVTGDHAETARSIAAQCGIYSPGNLIMEGAAFRALSPAGQADAARTLAVLARCSPMDKHALVGALQANGEVVAVTGDGTNDAPALKRADVGLAMGIAGTEVAKEAADIVIMDDHFSSIVASVRWGRSIKENIRKFLSFQLSINIVALFLTFVSACTSGGRNDLPLKPVQLLWVNMIMDSFAALALATEPPSERLMSQRPQGKAEVLITRTMTKNMLGHAAFQTLLLLWMTQVPASATFFGLEPAHLGNTHHDTIVFTTFVMLQVFNLFNCRAVHDEWNVLEGFGNSIIAQVILSIIVIMQVLIVQLGGTYMQTVPLSLSQWGACVGLGALSIPVGYLLKLLPACERELHAAVAPPSVDGEDLRAVLPDEAGHLARTVARAAIGVAPSSSGEDGRSSSPHEGGVEAGTLRSGRKRRQA